MLMFLEIFERNILLDKNCIFQNKNSGSFSSFIQCAKNIKIFETVWESLI